MILNLFELLQFVVLEMEKDVNDSKVTGIYKFREKKIAIFTYCSKITQVSNTEINL